MTPADIKEVLSWILGLEDAGAGIAMLWAGAKITVEWGFKNRHQVWATVRRCMYWAMSLALFALGLGRLAGWYPDPGILQFMIGSTIAVCITFFPLMRALGYISQDELIDK